MGFEHFGLLAPVYDRLIHPGEAEQFTRRIGLPIEGSLLDAGGGTGRIANSIRGMASQVIVSDVSMGMLRQAKNKALPVLKAPAERLPFPDEIFERVLMVDALHHVADQAATAQELWRVLKQGGRLVIVEPDIRQWIVKGIALFEKITLMRSHFLTPEKIADLFTMAGSQRHIEVEKTTAWVVIEK